MSLFSPNTEAHTNILIGQRESTSLGSISEGESAQPCGTPVLARNRPQKCSSASHRLKGFEQSVHAAFVHVGAACVRHSAQSVFSSVVFKLEAKL